MDWDGRRESERKRDGKWKGGREGCRKAALLLCSMLE